jgi:hypothetical protein
MEVNVFESNAAQLRDLHAATKATFARRDESNAQWEAWQEACLRFNTSYDALAFPGGIGIAMSLLEKNDPNTIEMVVQFLEADPWYFHSGYHKADMLKQLRHAPLSEVQRKRLQQVIVARIQEPETPREFRWYCHLAPFISDVDFERQVTGLAESADSVRARHAQWVWSQLRSARGSLDPVAADHGASAAPLGKAAETVAPK